MQKYCFTRKYSKKKEKFSILTTTCELVTKTEQWMKTTTDFNLNSDAKSSRNKIHWRSFM